MSFLKLAGAAALAAATLMPAAADARYYGRGYHGGGYGYRHGYRGYGYRHGYRGYGYRRGYAGYPGRYRHGFYRGCRYRYGRCY